MGLGRRDASISDLASKRNQPLDECHQRLPSLDSECADSPSCCRAVTPSSRPIPRDSSVLARSRVFPVKYRVIADLRGFSSLALMCGQGFTGVVLPHEQHQRQHTKACDPEQP